MTSYVRRRPVARYVLVALAGSVCIYVLWVVLGPGPTHFAGGARVALASYRGPDPTGVPAELSRAALVERGQYLAHAADCEACHTAQDGVPYAGGRAFVLPFGTLYSTNITPDEASGIGHYDDAQFLSVLHRGIGPGGTRLYPAMPYASYTYMTDADALAIKAYLFSLKSVHAPAPEMTLKFPFNQRWLMAVWATLFNPGKRFEPNAQRSGQWNRGAYLVEAMAHCGECHTPRNLFQGLDNRRKFAGTVQAGWRAYNITSDKRSGVGEFSDADLRDYIAIGHADGHGTAAGPMGEAVDKSLSRLTPSDVSAIVVYLRSIPARATADLAAANATPAPASHRQGTDADLDPRGKAVFEGACASCHGWTGVSPLTRFATLTGARAVNDPTAQNVAQVVLGGAQRQTPDGPVEMPGFGAAYSDVEIAAVANYVTARFGVRRAATEPGDVAQLRKLQ